MTLKPIYIFSLLLVAFLTFSLSIYLKPAFAGTPRNPETIEASKGRMVWQQYNCQSCHQLYGLGGYLGPDLTNVYGTEGKGEPLIRAIIKTGVAPMPAFDLTAEETAQLVAFLKAADASGSADPRGFLIHANGMIEPK